MNSFIHPNAIAILLLAGVSAGCSAEDPVIATSNTVGSRPEELGTFGSGTDIGVNGHGTVWIIGTIPVGNGDFSVHKFNGSSWDQAPSNVGGIRIDVAPTGIPWIVSQAGPIYRLTTSDPSTGTWELVPGGGLAKDIGVGADGGVWVIGTNPVGNSDFGVFKFNGSGWDQTIDGGGGVRISVGQGGVPWLVNSAGAVYMRTSSSPFAGQWSQINVSLHDIGVGDDGSLWGLSTIIPYPQDFVLINRDRSSGTWGRSGDGAIGLQITVGYSSIAGFNVPFMVDSQHRVFRGSSPGWLNNQMQQI